jgi:hypothetical protein
MTIAFRFRHVALCLCSLLVATRSPAQVIESVGTRAQGMGGAFVAVATDSTATWWNPGALAAGPFVDISLSRAVIEQEQVAPESRGRSSWFALGTPPIGVSYYRLQLTDIRPVPATDSAAADREDVPAAVRSLTVRQLGATVVHTLVAGVHVGATLKYVRGTGRTAVGNASLTADDLLDAGEELEGGKADNHFDLDLGVLATAGVLRLGGLVRNVREPEFANGQWRLPRQFRAGVALDFEQGDGPPLTVAFDADIRRYTAGTGDRRMVALGAEQWLFARRLGVRAGARFNAVGDKARMVTGGASVAVRPGTFLEGHVVRGGSGEERGWGAGARVSF